MAECGECGSEGCGRTWIEACVEFEADFVVLAVGCGFVVS